MTFENLLKNYNDTKRKIKSNCIKYEEMKQLYTFPKTEASFDNMPKPQGFNGSCLEKFIVALTELEEKNLELEMRCEGIRNDIEKIIELNTIDNRLAFDILEYRLFLNHNWKTITRLTNYSLARVNQLYNGTILKIKKSENN